MKDTVKSHNPSLEKTHYCAHGPVPNSVFSSLKLEISQYISIISEDRAFIDLYCLLFLIRDSLTDSLSGVTR